MVVNFRIRKISRVACKLTQILMLIKKKYSKPISFTIFLHSEGATPFFFLFFSFIKTRLEVKLVSVRWKNICFLNLYNEVMLAYDKY
jgi:hypothetical protein